VAEKNKPDTERTLIIERIFDAPRRLVFEAWTKGEHLKRWCAPKGFTIPDSEGDIRPGGSWRSHMRSPDGQDFRISGVYREVIPNELLVFTHGWEDENGKRGHETVVTVRFADQGKKTKLTLQQAVFETVGARDGHQGGWSECLDRLAEHLETMG